MGRDLFDSDNNYSSSPGKGIGIAILIVAALIALSVGGYFYSVASRTATGIIERTADPDNVLYNYEYFKNEHRQILAYDNQIATAKTNVAEAEQQPRAERDFRDKEEIARQRTILQGLRNQRDNAVGEYNANARKANRSIFMGTDVPQQLMVDKASDRTVASTFSATASQQ